MANGSDSPWSKVWDVLLKISIPVVLASGGMVVGLHVRVSTIEGNRFTNRDAQEMERRIMAMFPPSWLVQDIRDIKTSLGKIDDRLRVLENQK